MCSHPCPCVIIKCMYGTSYCNDLGKNLFYDFNTFLFSFGFFFLIYFYFLYKL
jgi:hypothetical protein